MKLYIKSSYINDNYTDIQDAVISDIFDKIYDSLGAVSYSYDVNSENFNISNLRLDPASEYTLDQIFDSPDNGHKAQYDFDLSYEDSDYSLPFHIDYKSNGKRAYGSMVCDDPNYANDSDLALAELVDVASGIDREKQIRYDNGKYFPRGGIIVDKDILNYMLNLKSSLENQIDTLFSETYNLNWYNIDDSNVSIDDSSYYCGKGNIAVFIRCTCDKQFGSAYIKSGKSKNTKSFSPIIFNAESYQGTDEGIKFSNFTSFLVFPKNPDDEERQYILNIDENQLCKFMIDNSIKFINKHIGTYTVKPSNKVKTSDLLEKAVDIWDVVCEDDWRHEMSQEALIYEVIDRLKDRYEFTKSQEQAVVDELSSYGEFIYEAPNGEHYDTDQPWL